MKTETLSERLFREMNILNREYREEMFKVQCLKTAAELVNTLNRLTTAEANGKKGREAK